VFLRCGDITRVFVALSARDRGHRLRQACASVTCPAGEQRLAGRQWRVGCNRTQLNVLGPDPTGASRRPGTLETTDAARTDRRFHAARNEEMAGSGDSDGQGWAGCKPSAYPTLIRTQHLPLKTPGQARYRCSRMPGLIRVRGRFGRPLTVPVGQWWARSGLVSGSGTGAPGIGYPWP
jgi:hypothetical protein